MVVEASLGMTDGVAPIAIDAPWSRSIDKIIMDFGDDGNMNGVWFAVCSLVPWLVARAC